MISGPIDITVFFARSNPSFSANVKTLDMTEFLVVSRVFAYVGSRIKKAVKAYKIM